MRRGTPGPGIEGSKAVYWPLINDFGVLGELWHALQAEQEQAREAHLQWLANPRRPGLRFKKVHNSRPIYSVQVSLNVRAVGVMAGENMIWFWIGPHDGYEIVLKRL